MSDSALSLADAIAGYLASLSADERQVQQQELTKFARWYGADRPMGQLGVVDVDDYVAYVENSSADSAQRLKPVRAFLGYAKRQGLTEVNLSVHVRIRRTTAKRVAAPPREQMTVQLTPEGHARLQAELADLISQRPRLAEEIRRAAADKDFRENAPLEAAREHQGQVEARIRELEATLKVAKVLEETSPDGPDAHRISLGSTVVLHDLAYDEEVTYTLVEPTEADPRKGKLSITSPTGRALLDHVAGEAIEVDAPAGAVHYRIVEVS